MVVRGHGACVFPRRRRGDSGGDKGQLCYFRLLSRPKKRARRDSLHGLQRHSGVRRYEPQVCSAVPALNQPLWPAAGSPKARRALFQADAPHCADVACAHPQPITSLPSGFLRKAVLPQVFFFCSLLVSHRRVECTRGCLSVPGFVHAALRRKSNREPGKGRAFGRRWLWGLRGWGFGRIESRVHFKVLLRSFRQSAPEECLKRWLDVFCPCLEVLRGRWGSG